jgi:translation initiation factor IF-2
VALRPEPTAIPTTEQQRRQQTKPAARDRRKEIEEGKLLYQSRKQELVQATNKEITISEGITVKELAEKMGIKAADVIKHLVSKKIFATINQTLDVKLAEDLARDFGAATSQMTYEQESTQDIDSTEIETDREKRAPVVTIMGHVDHGKTSLLDSIREANVAAREAGGITQHIGAYRIEHNGNKIAFIDTPGHEAFTRMRARGAKVTDIVILVVAADDGVMPQTLEAIDHAKAAGVPIIVAINKIDRPDAMPERIKQQLADRGLLAEDWGGDVVMVPVSAKTKQNLDLLMEMILLVSEMQNLRANPNRPALATVLEAKLDRGRGPVATILIRNGTLNVGDYYICGSVFGRVRAMYNDLGEAVQTAEPSMPVEVIGLESLPEVGDTFQVVTDTAKAKQIVEMRESKARDIALAKSNRVTLESLHQHLREGDIKELNIIIKADVGGTAEVLSDTLQKLSNEKVRLKVIRSGVGAINEGDVVLASASQAIIVGFNVRPERNAAALAEQEQVEIRLHTIIYNLTDEIKKAMAGKLEPVFKEVYQGRAEVRETFRISGVGTVAGCYVQDGFIKRDSQMRLLRDNVVITTTKVDALKRFKNDTSEVKSGFECGISLVNFQDIKPGDVLEAFVTEKVAQEAFA